MVVATHFRLILEDCAAELMPEANHTHTIIVKKFNSSFGSTGISTSFPHDVFDQMLADRSIACTQLTHRSANPAAEKGAQRHSVRITNLGGDQINAVIACL